MALYGVKFWVAHGQGGPWFFHFDIDRSAPATAAEWLQLIGDKGVVQDSSGRAFAGKYIIAAEGVESRADLS